MICVYHVDKGGDELGTGASFLREREREGEKSETADGEGEGEAQKRKRSPASCSNYEREERKKRTKREKNDRKKQDFLSSERNFICLGFRSAACSDNDSQGHSPKWRLFQLFRVFSKSSAYCFHTQSQNYDWGKTLTFSTSTGACSGVFFPGDLRAPSPGSCLPPLAGSESAGATLIMHWFRTAATTLRTPMLRGSRRYLASSEGKRM